MDIKDVIKLFCHTNKPIIYTIVYDKVIILFQQYAIRIT